MGVTGSPTRPSFRVPLNRDGQGASSRLRGSRLAKREQLPYAEKKRGDERTRTADLLIRSELFDRNLGTKPARLPVPPPWLLGIGQ